MGSSWQVIAVVQDFKMCIRDRLNGLVGIPADKANDFFKRSMEASDMIIKSGKFALFNQDPDPAANYQQPVSYTHLDVYKRQHKTNGE